MDMRKFIFSLGFMVVSLTALAEEGRDSLSMADTALMHDLYGYAIQMNERMAEETDNAFYKDFLMRLNEEYLNKQQEYDNAK